MSLALSGSPTASTGSLRRHKIRATIRTWLCTWELYPIMLIASILRLGWLNTTPFAGDQSVLYQLAYDAVHYGLLPATSNSASIFTMHSPLAIYFLMLPVLFSSDPLWAAYMTALLNVVAVLLAYIFTRRYYGRTAAIIAAMLFATAQTAIVFSRFIWQPTLLSPFVLLFLFALFRGVVERRKGWLAPALLLLGVLYQLHEITILMAALLFAALLLSPHTIRIRDIVLGFICLLVLFLPYLVWEVNSNFADIHALFSLTQAHALIDSKAIMYYQRFLNAYYYDDRFRHATYYDPVGSASSVVVKLLPLLIFTRYILLTALACAFIMAGILILRSTRTISSATISHKRAANIFRLFTRLYQWWLSLRDDPFRCGLLLLLLWQVVPVLFLSRHTGNVHIHYLLMVLPGPFILIGFLFSRVISWLQMQPRTRLWQRLRYGIYGVTALLLAVQLLGSAASLFDTVHGINNRIFGYNALGSLEHAVQEADQVARTHSLKRVYISISFNDDSLTSLPYLASQMHTPSTLFDASSCLMLPSVTAGPVVFLLRSTDTVGVTLLSHFATATIVDKPPLLGTSPFLLYIVKPPAVQLPTTSSEGFAQHLQLLDAQAQQLPMGASFLLSERWTLLQNMQPVPLKAYTYILRVSSHASHTSLGRTDCTFTNSNAGDQLITGFRLSSGTIIPSPFDITSQMLIASPSSFTEGPLHFETYRMNNTLTSLHSVDGGDTVTMNFLRS